ncbi:D-glycerate dehydrogenase [Candidatus Microgenomates bacterium]|nr:D-glycerate dehydrogenase [Candidatus Microgenomates bacterium]
MKIFVTRRIPGSAFEKLKEAGEVVVSPNDRPITLEELIVGVRDADALLCILTDHIDAKVMDQAPNLKVISNYAVGFDNVDVTAATEHGIVIVNTPSDEVSEAVAEFAWTLMLTLSRRVIEGDEFGRKGAYRGWEPDLFLGRNVYGKTLGIVGLGRIGTMVARRANGFNMKVLYNKRERDERAEQELGIQFADLDTLLAESDFVTLHVPLTDETRHMISEPQLSKMKQSAYLVNTARGGIVDEHALVAALKSGKIAGAALDVHENEPEMNPELLLMENVILTPHVASATVEVREKMTEQAVDAIIKSLKGEKPENLVNLEVWEKRRK